MPREPSESYTVNMKGGTGGSGGTGHQQGGDGGPGLGPTLNVNAEIIHIVINQGTEKEEIKNILRQDFLNWLSPINFFLQQADISQLRTKGTGRWLVEHPLFKQWESGSESTLWCLGIPGAGKTVLVSMAVDHLRAACKNNKDIGVACIYLNHKEVDNQTPSRLLAGLWRQLVLGRDIGTIAKELYLQHREKGTAPLLEEVVRVLSSIVMEFSKVFIIIDAIDEYPEFQREILLQHLAAMGSIVNLMITSRPNISLEPSSFPNLERLDILAMEEDLQRYIDAQIVSSPRLHMHVQRQPKLQEEIYSKINTQTVDGMFLLAKLHIESLSTKNTIKAVREALNTLPKNLNDSYDIAMQRIEAQTEEDRRTAHSTLIWVANAKRPLKVSEITVALAIEPGNRQLDKDNVLDIKIILAVCAGLVIVDEQLSVVRLVHYTTQEYLDSIQTQQFPDAQTEITCTLLTYLAFDVFPDPFWSYHFDDMPLLVEYSQYCLAHAIGQPEVQLRGILLEFLDRAFQWKRTMLWRWNSPPWNYLKWPLQPSLLWIAAAANLIETAKFLLKEVPLLQHSKNPEIIVASYYGHLKMVELLVENGADINAAGGEYGSALEAAIAGGHREIVHILVDKGANVNAAGGKYGSLLQAVAAGGHTEIVGILVEKGADVNAAGGEYGSILQAAIAGGHTEIVRILVDKGANVNAAGGKYGSILQAAVAGGHVEIVCILVEGGANINAAGVLYGSPLQAAIAGGHREIVHILVEKGADVNAAGGVYGSILQAAIARGHTEIVHVLVEKGANVNAAEGKYGSPLQAAIAGGHREIVCILVEGGANVNAAGVFYGSPLQVAIAGGHREIVHILVEKGADVNATGGEYWSILQAAIAGGYTEIVHVLVEKGANVNAAEGEYGSLLQTAIAGGHIEIVGILVEKGVNVNTAGGAYGSVLQAAVARGHTEIVRILVDKGANVNAAGGFYGSLLQAAAAGGHREIVSILVDKGADVNAAGGKHGSALQAAAAGGRTEIVGILVEKGADVNVAGGEYGSPLQAAAAGGRTEIVGILVNEGADVNAGRGHRSALQAAAAGGYTEIVGILVDKGADVNAVRGEYGTALEIAIKRGHNKIVTLLLERDSRSK